MTAVRPRYVFYTGQRRSYRGKQTYQEKTAMDHVRCIYQAAYTKNEPLMLVAGLKLPLKAKQAIFIGPYVASFYTVASRKGGKTITVDPVTNPPKG